VSKAAAATSAKSSDDFLPQSKSIREFKGKDIAVIGKVEKVTLNHDKTKLIIFFDVNVEPQDQCKGRYALDQNTPGMSIDDLAPYQGKQVRLRGKVAQESGYWYIDLKKPSQIELVKE
jgi:hypothetical protein